MEPKHKLGLALSGGGYRAAAFHLGTLNKLNDLGILDEVDVISTISGGSITGAAWMLSEEAYPEFHEKIKADLSVKSVIGFAVCSPAFLIPGTLIIASLLAAVALTFTELAWLSYLVLTVLLIILFRFQYQLVPVSELIEKAYDKYFYHGATLDMFKTTPVIAIGTSNLHTGRPFTFSRDKIGDTFYSKECKPPVTFLAGGLPVARAVAASSCVPFAFTPVKISPDFYTDPADAERVHPQLIDGGVYDNQGIQKLTEQESSYSCEIVIVSDAGGGFMADKIYRNTIGLLLRTVELFMYRIKASQMQKNLYQQTDKSTRPIAYFSLGWELGRCIDGFVNNLGENNINKEVVAAHGLEALWVSDPALYRDQIRAKLQENVDYDRIAKLRPEEWSLALGVGTNLTPLKKREIEYLIIHAESLTELQVKLYCPMLLSIHKQAK
ncbi:hypothetical protein A0256_08890 [Mucilaginibacter sp. PAMC 26640]|nr:hypothetical protein A0256_08890 [Mucilaginibacter sp. PAMC 26640]